MEELKEYHNIVQEMWKLFKASMVIAGSITSANDPRWIKINSDFKRICDNVSPAEQDYADSMMRLHIYELERRWRK